MMNNSIRYWAAPALVAVMALAVGGPVSAEPAYRIGFSQATTVEPWRILFNQDVRIEAAKHPDLELIVRDGNDSVDKQAADVRELLATGIDALLISPKEAAGLGPAVQLAVDSGVPVFVLDRNVDARGYTQFIGGDNRMIGQAAGRFAVNLLGGPGKARGVVTELWGGMRTQTSRDRHDGFHDEIGNEPGIRVVGEAFDCDWKQDLAYRAMIETMEQFDHIDLVYAHNDPMAYGAYLAAMDDGRDDVRFFLGIDGIPSEGVRWVYDGILTATFLYMTPGAEGLRQALAYLSGNPVPDRVVLPTEIIDRARAEEILRERGLLD